MDFFPRANTYLQKTLGFRYEPENSDQFRSVLKRAGKRRFLQAVRLVYEQNLSPKQRPRALTSAMWDLIPPKTTPYRNKHTQKALEDSRALDDRLDYLISHDE